MNEGVRIKRGWGKEERVVRRGKVWRKPRRIRVWGEERVVKENMRV